MTRRIERIDADVSGLARAVVVARDVAAVLAGVDDVGIGRIGGSETGLAAADGMPVAGRNASPGEAVARPGTSADVLHRAGDMVGQPIIDTDVIELTPGHGRS